MRLKHKIYKSPLSIYVIWHPNFAEGEKYANKIYSAFCRDVERPLSRGLGIPVFYRFQNLLGAREPLEIDLKESDRNAIVVLVDETMFLDQSWCNYVRALNKKTGKNTRLYPISFFNGSYHIDENGLGKNQFIRAHDHNDTNPDKQFNIRWEFIRSQLLHDFSRLMLNMHSIFKASADDIPPPVKLFISHAKHDGEKEASEFRNYIESSTKLNTFFDTNDIADGYEFEMQIKRNINKNIAVVIFHTDEYSNREWCRIEVITAKRYKAPLVVVHNITKGEKRSFPYMGNAPTIKWDNNFEEIIDLALIQVLNNLFAHEKLEKYITLYNAGAKNYCIDITSPPELFNFIDIENKKKETRKPVLVIYPDPPLGIEELNVLNDLDKKIKFITPTLLPNII